MTLQEHERKASLILQKARVDSPGLCARILAAHAAGLTLDSYILAANMPLEPDKAESFWKMVQRRATGEPLAYILGKKEFYSLDFKVTNAVLCPRPETELLVDLCLNEGHQDRLTFADIGCGCGCIGVTLGVHRPNWAGFLLDNSLEALAIAKDNCRTLKTALHIIQGDIFALPFADASLDLLVSNPPYIAESEKNEVMWEILRHEPRSALFSPHNGLGHIMALAKQGRRILARGGRLLIEHGWKQGQPVVDILAGVGFVEIRDIMDLANLPRCASCINP